MAPIAKKSSITPIIIAAALVVIAAVVAVIFGMNSNGNIEAKAMDYVEALYVDFDGEKLVESMPKPFVDSLVEKRYDGDMDDYINDCQNLICDSQKEDFEDDNIEIKELKVSECNDMEANIFENLLEELDDYDDLEVEEGKTVCIDAEFIMAGREMCESLLIDVLKINGEWGVVQYY